MSLPRFAMLDDDDDSTAPAQFLLKLPPSYSRRLAELAPPTPGEWMIPVAVSAPEPAKAKPRPPARLIAAVAGAAVAFAIVAGGAFAFAQSSGDPVGISKHAPKKMEHAARLPTWQTGLARVQPQHHPSSKKRGKR